eukprot:g628.t1
MIFVDLDGTFDVDYKKMVKEKKRQSKRHRQNVEEGATPGEEGKASGPLTPSSSSKSRDEDSGKTPIARTQFASIIERIERAYCTGAGVRRTKKRKKRSSDSSLEEEEEDEEDDDDSVDSREYDLDDPFIDDSELADQLGDNSSDSGGRRRKRAGFYVTRDGEGGEEEDGEHSQSSQGEFDDVDEKGGEAGERASHRGRKKLKGMDKKRRKREKKRREFVDRWGNSSNNASWKEPSEELLEALQSLRDAAVACASSDSKAIPSMLNTNLATIDLLGQKGNPRRRRSNALIALIMDYFPEPRTKGEIMRRLHKVECEEKMAQAEKEFARAESVFRHWVKSECVAQNIIEMVEERLQAIEDRPATEAGSDQTITTTAVDSEAERKYDLTPPPIQFAWSEGGRSLMYDVFEAREAYVNAHNVLKGKEQQRLKKPNVDRRKVMEKMLEFWPKGSMSLQQLRTERTKERMRRIRVLRKAENQKILAAQFRDTLETQISTSDAKSAGENDEGDEDDSVASKKTAPVPEMPPMSSLYDDAPPYNPDDFLDSSMASRSPTKPVGGGA